MTDIVQKVLVTNPSDITLGTVVQTIADGADVALGAKADSAAVNSTSSATAIALLKGIFGKALGSGYTSVKIVPTITTTPYSANDCVGGKQTLTNILPNSTGLLESLVVLDKSNSKAAFDILIFDADPTAATITDNATFVFSTDNLKVIARISVATGDYITLNSQAIALKASLGVALKASATALYAAVITTSTPTYAVGDLQFVWGIRKD